MMQLWTLMLVRRTNKGQVLSDTYDIKQIYKKHYAKLTSYPPATFILLSIKF